MESWTLLHSATTGKYRLVSNKGREWYLDVPSMVRLLWEAGDIPGPDDPDMNGWVLDYEGNNVPLNQAWNSLPTVREADPELAAAADAAREEYERAYPDDAPMFCEACEREIRPEWIGVGVVSGRWLCSECCAKERSTMRAARPSR